MTPKRWTGPDDWQRLCLSMMSDDELRDEIRERSADADALRDFRWELRRRAIGVARFVED